MEFIKNELKAFNLFHIIILYLHVIYNELNTVLRVLIA